MLESFSFHSFQMVKKTSNFIFLGFSLQQTKIIDDTSLEA